mgnify:CR=1 FL=1
MNPPKTGSGRRKENVKLSEVLERVDLGLCPILASARRLYRMIVGPTVASESDPIALHGTVITIAGQTRETIRTIQEQEGFLLRTWGERLEAGRIQSIRYEVRPMKYEQVAPEQLPEPTVMKRLEPSKQAHELAACIKDTKLRDSMAQWMAVVEARSKEDM